MASHIERREFLAALGSAAAAWPLTARAQTKQMRRIGVLMAYAEDDPEAQPGSEPSCKVSRNTVGSMAAPPASIIAGPAATSSLRALTRRS
jgi:hypothetical protein